MENRAVAPLVGCLEPSWIPRLRLLTGGRRLVVGSLAEQDKPCVFVFGFDGADHALCRRSLQEGYLTNLEKSAQIGSRRRIRPTPRSLDRLSDAG